MWAPHPPSFARDPSAWLGEAGHGGLRANRLLVATRRELPADFAAALDEYPAARDRFAALSVQRQNE
jgi:uncharacterized protein YdeI (YjbR/CyaY-like superfamily)